MEPIWLGIAAPSILSSAGNLARAAVSPFSAVLDRATNVLDGSESDEETKSEKAGLDGHSLLQLGGLRTHAERLGESLQARMHRALEDAGISVEEPVQFRVSPIDGQIEVVGDAPKRSAIEAALAADPSIGNDFRQLSALHALLSAAEKHLEFAAAYARDPEQAVGDFSELFDSVNVDEPVATLTEMGLSFSLQS